LSRAVLIIGTSVAPPSAGLLPAWCQQAAARRRKRTTPVQLNTSAMGRYCRKSLFTWGYLDSACELVAFQPAEAKRTALNRRSSPKPDVGDQFESPQALRVAGSPSPWLDVSLDR